VDIRLPNVFPPQQLDKQKFGAALGEEKIGARCPDMSSHVLSDLNSLVCCCSDPFPWLGYMSQHTTDFQHL